LWGQTQSTSPSACSARLSAAAFASKTIFSCGVEDALKAIDVPYTDVTFGKEDVHSSALEFKPGPIYLAIEHKPPFVISVAKQ